MDEKIKWDTHGQIDKSLEYDGINDLYCTEVDQVGGEKFIVIITELAKKKQTIIMIWKKGKKSGFEKKRKTTRFRRERPTYT